MSYSVGPVKCGHCGDPPLKLRDGRIAKHGRDPVCLTCLRMLEEDNLPDFLDFLRLGGKIDHASGGRKAVKLTVTPLRE
jgi:hypothetical protein